MRKYIKLSYDIREDTPLYPGSRPIEIKKAKEISKGDSCNTFFITLPNHAGTHIDAPRHFYDSGRAIDEYSFEDLVFKKPILIDCPKGIEDVIEVNDLAKLADPKNPDLLLIRTGFYKYRKEDIHTYCYKNPYISPQAAKWIRGNFPNIKAIGIDCISIASYFHRESGRETHKILLKEDSFTGSAVLLIEDIYLSYEIKRIDELIVSPIFIGGVDSSPCTVIGVIED